MEEFMERLFMGNPFLENPFMGTPFMENPTFLGNPFMRRGDHFTSDFEDSSVVLESSNFQRFCFERVKQLSVDEKIQVAYDYLGWSKEFPAMQQQSPKSADRASQFRTAGNKAFSRKDYQGALIYYTESVAVAPAHSEELALAYGNRSAVFMCLEKYEECLLEINRALKEKYPEHKKQKLRERKEKCVQRFRDTFNTIRLLPRAVVDTLQGQSKFEEFMKSFNPDNTEPLDYQNPMIPKISCENKTIPNASNKIKLKIKNIGDNKVGIFATANIKPGEVIAIEKPVAFTLYEQFTRSHCAYCFRRTPALIPCENCSMVMFCSTHCRKNATDDFHEVECQIFCGVSLNEGSRMLEAWVNLRLFLVITKQGRVLDEIMDQYERPLGKNLCPNLKEKFNSQNCSSVLLYGRLSMNNRLNDLNTGFDMIVFLNAVKLLYLLKTTTFFDKQRANNQNLDGKLTNRELYVAAFLMKCIQNDYYCIKEGIKRTSVPQPVGGKLVTLNIGHGIYPLLNNFGPSCEPHVRLFCHGNSLVCRAIRSIKAGEEILNNYCGLFSATPKYERALVCMRRFNFVCTCKPCRQDWPTDEMLPNTSSKVISDSVGAKKFQEYYSRFQKLLENPFEDAVGSLETREFLTEYLSILEKRFEKPCREINKCDLVLTYHFRMTANYYLAE